MTIAVDAMGGDYGPTVTVPAALQVLAKHKNLHLILVGDEGALQKVLPSPGQYDQSRLSIHHASQQVEMGESPTHALRSKKDSSMRVALNLLKEEKAQACVSAGNTGALVATARFVLKTLPGIDRPAIVATLPTQNGRKVRMLDLGATVDASPEQLVQFAIMGSVLASAVENITHPSIFLLNIGEEDIKGNEQVKQAAQLLANSKIVNYIGFVEGDQIYSGKADVIVCDGFPGNIALKASEGVASFIGKVIKKAFYQNLYTMFVGLLARPILKSVIKNVDPDQYNGATLIGLQGIVIKSHGGAKMNAFAHAIEEAVIEVERDINRLIFIKLEELLKSNPPGSQVV